MELWDAYDENFRRMEGVSLVRGEPIPAGRGTGDQADAGLSEGEREWGRMNPLPFRQ